MANLSNLTIIEIPSQPAYSKDLYIVILTSVLIAILIILTVAGNVMVLVTFCMCKELRSITNYFLVSLSIADLLTALLAMPIFLILRITNDQWDFPGGEILGKIYIAVDIICGTSSIWNLCLISMDRFLAIIMPLKHMVILTPRRAQVVIVIVWCFTLLLSSLLFVNWPYRVYPIITLSFLLPLALIIFSYAKIYKAMRSRSFVQRRRAGMKLKRDFRMAKQMILVIGSFIVCWFGFFVVTYILALKTIQVEPVVLHIVKVLTYLNSCLNPMLFTFISYKFKMAFTQIFHCQKPDLRKARALMSQRRTNVEQYHSIMNHSLLPSTTKDTRLSTPLIQKSKLYKTNTSRAETETSSSPIEKESTV